MNVLESGPRDAGRVGDFGVLVATGSLDSGQGIAIAGSAQRVRGRDSQLAR